MKKKSQRASSIYITEPDYHRLSGLIETTRERNGVDIEYLKKLEAELDRAEIVDPKRYSGRCDHYALEGALRGLGEWRD